MLRKTGGACAATLLLVVTLVTASDLPLVDAVKDRNVAAVRALLKKRVDVNAVEGDGATALHWAVYRDDLQMVDLMIGAGAKVNVANDLKITPLYLAAANGNAAIVERLLKAGANPDTPSETGVTPLMEAARTGSAGAVRSLLAQEAKVNAKETDRQQTALMWAAAQKHPEVTRILLDRGADVHARTGSRNLSVMDSGQRRVKQAKDGAMVIETGGSTALFFAAQSGDVESAQMLLKAGARVNDTASDGDSALVRAAFTGNGAVARTLLEAGADPNAAGIGYTALHAAALRGDLQTVQALLAKGANPNLPLTRGTPVRRFGSQWVLPGTIAGATPLLVAASYLEKEIVRALLAGGANPALGPPNGTTPLLAAAGSAVERLARPSDLIRYGVHDEDTPAIPRPEPDILETVRALVDKGADVNQANETGETALHAAAQGSLLSVIQLLADKGAKLDVKNRQGQTPLSMTVPRITRGSAPPNPESAAKSKAAEELLKKLGATPGN